MLCVTRIAHRTRRCRGSSLEASSGCRRLSSPATQPIPTAKWLLPDADHVQRAAAGGWVSLPAAGHAAHPTACIDPTALPHSHVTGHNYPCGCPDWPGVCTRVLWTLHSLHSSPVKCNHHLRPYNHLQAYTAQPPKATSRPGYDTVSSPCHMSLALGPPGAAARGHSGGSSPLRPPTGSGRRRRCCGCCCFCVCGCCRRGL